MLFVGWHPKATVGPACATGHWASLLPNCRLQVPQPSYSSQLHHDEGSCGRKPHLCFRFPAPFLQYYPALEDVPIAKHTVLDSSIPPIAHNDNSYSSYGPGQSPWKPLDSHAARRFRLYYAATISWADSQLGRVLDELDALGLEDSTVIVMHTDCIELLNACC